MNRRGQFVLLSAAVIAIAMVPMVFALLELGYHEDVRASGPAPDPVGDATSVLDRAVTAISADLPATYTWARRDAAGTTVRAELQPTISSLETSALNRGIHRNISYNATHAAQVRTVACPDGPDRQFGACEADEGLVVQERAGRTHLLAAVFDIETTAADRRTTATVVIEPT
jgi:hypothetical protein